LRDGVVIAQMRALARRRVRVYRTIFGICCGVVCAASTPPCPVWAHPDRDARLAILDQRTTANPCDAAAWLARGAVLRASRDWAAARAAYDRAAACDPGLDAVILARGELALESGEPEVARTLLDRYLAARPDEARARRLRGRALLALGRPAAAAADFDRGIARSARPEPDQYLERARALHAAGRSDEALAGLDAGVARLGPVPSLQQLAVEVDVERRRWDAALQRVERAGDGAPDREFWLLRRAEILEVAGRTGAARAAYAAARAAIAARAPQRRALPAVQALEQRAQAAVERLAGREPDRGGGGVQ
jgi:tetratricopeptide (TPR) repeat protein